MTAPSTDLSAIRQIVSGLQLAGWTLDYVYDGEERVPVKDAHEAIALTTDLDEATLSVHKDTETGYVYFVLGNEPYEVAADWTLTLSDVLDPITDSWEA